MRAVVLGAAMLVAAACFALPMCASAPSLLDSLHTAHAPIRIDSDAEFSAANGVTGGSGTAADPWRISGWDINGALQAFCIYVGNTTQPFRIENCRAHNASGDFVSYYYTESGIIFFNVRNGSVSGTTVENTNFDGICLYGSEGCSVSGCLVRGNEYGITLMEGSDGNWINGTAMQNNTYYGISLIDSGGNLVSSCAARDNGDWGMSLSNGTGNRLEGNTVIGNGDGIHLWESPSNSAFGNMAKGNGNGIRLEYSDGNTLENNNASGNLEYGIWLESSYRNRMFHNRLENNSEADAMDRSGGNAWDGGYPAGGNRWGWYSAPDVDRDGFGDIPYTSIRGTMGARDRYPLMRPWFPDGTAPVAVAGPDIAVNEDSPVSLNGTASTDDVGIVNYTWAAGSPSVNETFYGAKPVHVFAEPGQYTLTLTAADSAGNTGTDTAEIAVLDITAPLADAGPDFRARINCTADFNGSASSDNVGIANYSWSFEKGGRQVLLYGPMASAVFDAAGNVTVTLVVADAAGNTDTDTVAVEVLAQEAEADGGVEPEPDGGTPGPEAVTGHETELLVSLGLMATAAIIAAAALLRRRTSRRP